MIFIRLRGEHDKRPRDKGWAAPDYPGVPLSTPGPLGLRCDGYVVVDCDTWDAAVEWTRRAPGITWERKTPRGRHFIYNWVEGAPLSQRIGILPGIDIKAGRGSQIVYRAKGYEGGYRPPLDFDPAWLPELAERASDGPVGEGLDEMPDGVGNRTMFRLACYLRRQGWNDDVIADMLTAFNKRTMRRKPMGVEDIMKIVSSAVRYEPGEPETDLDRQLALLREATKGYKRVDD